MSSLFSDKKKFNTEFQKFENLQEIIKNNRKTLSTIDSWINNEIYTNSIFGYGIPDSIKDLIDLPINDDPTYSDLIVAHSYLLNKGVNYLEIGVSVGKNFFQLMNGLRNSKLTGIDIEELNPVLEKQMKFISCEEYEIMHDSIKKNNLSEKKYNYKTNRISYISGDVWDSNTWQKLSGQKFNLIFSDALHDPKAILFEYNMIEKLNLLDDSFIYIWDDLVGEMKDAFIEIARRMNKKYKINNTTFYLLKVNGWLGQNYPIKHDVGIITSLK